MHRTQFHLIILLTLFIFFAVLVIVPGNAVMAGNFSIPNGLQGSILSSTPSPTMAVPEGICSPLSQTPCAPEDQIIAQQPSEWNDSRDGVVRAVLFWMQGCPHCEIVFNTVLPPLEQKYGEALEILKVELTSIEDVDKLYKLGDRLGINKDGVGVPFMMIGDHVLVGDKLIGDKIVNLVDQEHALGGIDFPTVPEFNIRPENASNENSQDQVSTENQVAIYLFWGDGCPHCAVAKPFLQRLDEASKQVELRMFEVWYVEENQDLFTKMASAYGFEPHYVPTIFIGTQYWEGYNDQIENEIQAAVNACLIKSCPDAGAGIIPGVVEAQNIPDPIASEPTTTKTEEKTITLPLIGSINLTNQSLLVNTLLISFIDGFNPCSIWVLTMLLALTLHTGSRKKVLLIGLIFLTVTAAIYALFITGLFTMFRVISFVGWIQAVVALVALFFALVNIKDYFWYKQGVSLTISDKNKPGIFQRIRRLMDASQSFWGLVGGTIILAAGVSLVEFSCTAGFPVIWTNLLASQNVPALTFGLLLLVYLIIYQLDEMGIFMVAVFSMRASKLEEKHGRILKLVGGMLMLALAGVMLFNPTMMNSLSSSFIVFGIASGATILILLLHRLILPRFGIYVGTEFSNKSKKQTSR